MRNDMHKVVTERPRRNPGAKYREVGRVNLQDCMQFLHSEEQDGVPFHLSRKFLVNSSMRRPYRIGYDNSKQFSDLISPLIRYLHSSVGKKWDDVFSEICQNLPRNGVNADHIRLHITQSVAVNYLTVDGDLFENNGYRLWHDLYVDQNGILQKTPRRNYKEPNDREEDWQKHRVKAGAVEFLKDPQTRIWYQIQSRVFVPDLSVLYPKTRERCYLLETRETHSTMWAKSHGYKYYPGSAWCSPGGTYYTKIKQASKKDIKKYGLI